MNIEQQHFIAPDIRTQDQSPKTDVFTVSESDLRGRFGWDQMDILHPLDGNGCPILFRFPLKCELALDPETQKTKLVVTLIKDNPEMGVYYAIDMHSTAQDLTSMGYLEEGRLADFIYQMQIANPNPEILNNLDGQAETTGEFKAEFDLETCPAGVEGQVCVIIKDTDSNEAVLNENIAAIPVFPYNELEFSIRQRNIEQHQFPTEAAKETLRNGLFGTIVTIFGAAVFMSWANRLIQKAEQLNPLGELHSAWDRNTEKVKAVVKKLPGRRG
ncbi:MAG: hypothetical protein ACHQUA_02105 [Microgenomates group bacterium]